VIWFVLFGCLRSVFVTAAKSTRRRGRTDELRTTASRAGVSRRPTGRVSTFPRFQVVCFAFFSERAGDTSVPRVRRPWIAKKTSRRDTRKRTKWKVRSTSGVRLECNRYGRKNRTPSHSTRDFTLCRAASASAQLSCFPYNIFARSLSRVGRRLTWSYVYAEPRQTSRRENASWNPRAYYLATWWKKNPRKSRSTANQNLKRIDTNVSLLSRFQRVTFCVLHTCSTNDKKHLWFSVCSARSCRWKIIRNAWYIYI